MKIMVLIKASPDSEGGRLPKHEEFEAMIAFNEGLAKDGMLVACEGLRPSKKGTRVRFDAGRTTATDGPFAETKELVAGFWIVEVKSRADVVERFSRLPFERGETIEIRELFQAEDFGEEFSEDQRERAAQVQL